LFAKIGNIFLLVVVSKNANVLLTLLFQLKKAFFKENKESLG
jgi:hypothetical protein